MFKSFIAPSDAKQKLSEDPDVKVLFTTLNSMCNSKPSDILELNITHYIPNSILFDFENSICDTTSRLSNMMPPFLQFQTQVSNLGISNSDTLFVYDDFGNFCASRVWFMFKTMGFDNIFVIDGGLPKWLDLGYATTEQLSDINHSNKFTARPSKQFKFVDAHHVTNSINHPDRCIIDARGETRFNGLTEETRPNLRSGHIPSSINIPYASLQSRQGMNDLVQLTKAFEPYLHKKELIFSCGSGVTACILAQSAFEVLSSKTQLATVLSVYDGSWSEWGADNKFKVEK